ncbi:hypothetical protein FNV43_RR07976 [Rhamnella rubrinervis]|uniref:Uncharacterized protein n=1 Tax=Rhamnella rubrinervis TaxID=2594499 RepID=A0A8K0MNH9_9ROSA|nr:hypothetical protein FNV43_RR07976 [Rhamnella rubrinervis]
MLQQTTRSAGGWDGDDSLDELKIIRQGARVRLWLSSSDLREFATDIHGGSEIRDQVFDEKNDTVTIKVVCCSPEKIKEKIICKGGGCIESIQIVVPQKQPKQPEKRKEPEKQPEKSKESEKQPEMLKGPEKCGPCYHGYGVPEKTKEPVKPENPKPAPPPPALAPPPVQVQPREGFCCQECYDGYPGGPCFHGYGEPEEPAPPPPAQAPVPVPGYPLPLGACCQQCYDGYPGGPCFQGDGRPPQRYQYDGYGGRPVCDSYGGGRTHFMSRCDYLSAENPSGCTIM